MTSSNSVNITIHPTWNIIKEIQEKTSKFIEGLNLSKDFSDSTVMCATELIENAIKYGSEKPGGGNIEFNLNTDGKKIVIMISNGVRSEDEIRVCVMHIEKIKNSKDPSALYTERLKELMKNPKPGVSQLGLYRIAYEGKFRLDYTYRDRVLTITACRKI